MLAPYRVRTIEFEGGRFADAIFVKTSTSPRDILAELNLDSLPRGIITVSGGAKDFPPEVAERTRQVIETAIVPLTFQHDLLVIDGGTAAGVVKLIGEAFARTRTTDPETGSIARVITNRGTGAWSGRFLMGFVPAPKVTYPGLVRSRQTRTPLEPNHLAFVLVMDVQEWGGEVKTLFKFLNYLSGYKHIPIASLVVNGGRITIKEVYHAARQGRHIILLEGSKRATEVMVAAMEGATPRTLVDLLEQRNLVKNARELRETLRWLHRIAHYEKITRFPFLSRPPDELKQIILSRLDLAPG